MRLLSLSLLSLPLSLSALTASAEPLSADIFYWSLSASSSSSSSSSAPEPSPLAKISYDPSTLQSTIDSYTPPQSINDNSILDKQADLLRVGLYTAPTDKSSADKQWVGTLSSFSLFANTPQTLTLHLDQHNRVYHATISSSASDASSGPDSNAKKGSKGGDTSPSQDKGQEAGAGSLKVEFVRTNPSPNPHLNRPVVLNPDGNAPVEVVEKSFLQKYWWVLGIIAVLAFTGSAEGS